MSLIVPGGVQVQLTATIYNIDGRPSSDVTETSEWASSNEVVATVNNTNHKGLVTTYGGGIPAVIDEYVGSWAGDGGDPPGGVIVETFPRSNSYILSYSSVSIATPYWFQVPQYAYWNDTISAVYMVKQPEMSSSYVVSDNIWTNYDVCPTEDVPADIAFDWSSPNSGINTGSGIPYPDGWRSVAIYDFRAIINPAKRFTQHTIGTLIGPFSVKFVVGGREYMMSSSFYLEDVSWTGGG